MKLRVFLLTVFLLVFAALASAQTYYGSYSGSMPINGVEVYKDGVKQPISPVITNYSSVLGKVKRVSFPYTATGNYEVFANTTTSKLAARFNYYSSTPATTAADIWDEPLSSHTTTGTAGRKVNDVSGAGQVINVLPSSGGGGAIPGVKNGGTYQIVKGSSTSIPYDLKMNVSGQTLYFGVKTEAGISKYSIAKRDITSGLTDSTLGTGLITLSMTDTNIPAGTYVGEIAKASGSPATAWAPVMRFTVIIMDPVVTP